MIDLGDLEPQAHASWEGLLDVAEVMAHDWALAGGQMIYLHCAERGYSPERPSDDGDVVLDVRTRPFALRDFVTALKEVGFRSAGVTSQGYQHRWVRDDATIDVLVPRFLGEGADRRDRSTRLSTIGAPGAQHLLNRSEIVDVSLHGRTGRIWRPDIMGALAAKSAAYREILVEEAKDRHLMDIMTLAGLLEARDLRGRGPWRSLERRRLGHAIGAIHHKPHVMGSFPDAAVRLARLVDAMRYFD